MDGEDEEEVVRHGGTSDEGVVGLIMEVEVIEDSPQPSPQDTARDTPDTLPFESSQASTSSIAASAISENIDPEDGGPAKKRKVSDDCEDDGRLCPICLDNWTNCGEHRICALKCGHLFGHGCILRWVLSNKTCPTCKVKSSRGDLRFIYANKLIAMDTSELEDVKKELNLRIVERDRIANDLAKAVCEQHLLRETIEDYKKKIRILTNQELPKSKEGNVKTSQGKLEWRLEDSKTVCPHGSCRVMDVHPASGKFVVSLKSPNSLFQGYGIRTFSIDTFAPITYTPLHTKAIRDIRLNQKNNNVLSVSLDKTVKIIDIQSFNHIGLHVTENMLWSCCWDVFRSEIFYVGEQQGSVTKFDLRRLNEPLDTFKIAGDMSPVVSIVSVPPNPGGSMPLGGFVACKLNSVWAFESVNGAEDYVKHKIEIESPFSCMSYDAENDQFLISARPNVREPNSRHIVTALQKCNGVLNPSTVYAFPAGRLQKQLSRSCFLRHSESTYVAANYDNSIGLWSVNSGQLTRTLRSHSLSIDLAPLNNSHGSYLLSLSEKKLDFYRVTS